MNRPSSQEKSPKEPSLKTTFLVGSFWTVGGQVLLALLGFVSVAVLARLLEPEDFGLIGLLASIIAILGLFREMGLPTAIVQKAEIKESELTSLFLLTVGLGVLVGGLATCAGIAASHFVDEPRLKTIAPWFGLCFFFKSIEAVPLGLLRRAFKFRQIVVRDLLAKVIGLAACIWAATLGMSYWSLVIQALVMAILNLVLTWIAARWRPTAPPVPWREISSYMKFGAALTGSNIASYLTQNLDNILIGKLSGLNSLGIYTRAKALMVAPLSQAMGPIGSVLIPIMSRLKDDPKKMTAWINKLSRLFIYLSAPGAAVLMVGSSDIIYVLLGEKWMDAAPIFWWLALFMAGAPLGSLLYWVLVCSGRNKLLISWTASGALLTCLAIAISALWGPIAVAASVGLVALFGRSSIAIYFSSKTGYFDYKVMLSRFFGGLLHGFSWLIVMTWCLGLIAPHTGSSWERLMILGSMSAILMAAVTWLTPFGRAVFFDSVELFRSIRPNKTA